MSKKTVIVTDDMLFMRKTLQKILEKDGNFEIIGEAENGNEAIKEYSLKKPDVITIDVTMPEMDGMEALEKIIKMDPFAKIVMISAVGHSVNREYAKKLGASGFINKPFEPNEVIEVLKKTTGIV